MAPCIRVFIAMREKGSQLHLLLLAERRVRQPLTLRSDRAVERVALDGDRLAGRLAVRLENVDSLDGVLGLSTRVRRFDGEDGVDGERGEEVVVAGFVKGKGQAVQLSKSPASLTCRPQ